MATDQTKSAKTNAGKAAAKGADKPVKASSGKPSKASAAAPNFFERIGKYFRDVRIEMRRVVWPNREEVVQSSVVVVVALAFFIVYVLVWDLASEWIFIDLPIRLFGGK